VEQRQRLYLDHPDHHPDLRLRQWKWEREWLRLWLQLRVQLQQQLQLRVLWLQQRLQLL
jgi:hypothetical protein